MSTVSARTLRPEIQSVLQGLKSKIQTYLFFHGLALVLICVCAFFLGTLAFDWFHFQLRKLELPVAVRAVMTLFVLIGVYWVLATQVVMRLLKSKRAQALALVLERRFPELDDRLITAVEYSDSRHPGTDTELTDAMVDRTVREVARSAQSLEISDVFDWKPLIVAWVVALSAMGAAGITVAASPESWDRWKRAFVYFDDVYWVRETNLGVVVLAEPGDRRREFVDGVYKHPRGADLKLLVSVPEGEQLSGEPWVVPESTEIEYEFVKSRGGDTKFLARRGEREFQFKMPSVLEDFQFWVSGNDYVNRVPYQIKVVDAPRAESITLQCDYPDYTQLDSADDAELDPRSLQGDQIDIPVETAFVLAVRANKTLKSGTVQAGPYEFTLGQFGDEADAARLRIYDARGNSEPVEALPEEFAQAAFSKDRRAIDIPFVLSAHPRDVIAARGPTRLPGEFGDPWILPPDSEVKVYLEDSDGILSAEPLKFTIRGQVDQPPKVDSEPHGIGTAITRKASIPLKGFITDDFGIDVAVFHFKIDDDENFRPRAFLDRPQDFPLEFRLQRNEEEEFERFEVLPLDLVVGQKLTLSVFARDGDNLNGPHEALGQQFTFKIVTADELLGLLYEREINLRRQFEQIISEVERTQKDLQDHRGLLDELNQLTSSQSAPEAEQQRIDEIRTALANCAERSLFQIGKNRAETASIRDSFERILDELVNNGVHTRQMTESLRQTILHPLTFIVEGTNPEASQAERVNTSGTFPSTDTAIGLFRQAMNEGDDPTARIDNSVTEVGIMLSRMRAVLSEMAELAELHEAISELKAISDEFEGIREDTIEERKNSLKNKLRGL